LNQVGTGVVIGGDGTVYITEDFLHSKGGTAAAAAAPATTAPRAAAPRATSTAAAPRPVTPRVAAAHPVAAAAKPAPVTTPATTATMVPAPVGVVNPVAFPAAPAATAATPTGGVLSNPLDGDLGIWAVMFGALLLVFAVSGPTVMRRRRLA
jgi:hypothetical protein